MPKKIIDAVSKHFPMSFNYFIERKALGTAGSVKAAQGWLNEKPFIVISGDALTNLDLAKIYDAHLKSDADITMAVKEVENPRFMAWSKRMNMAMWQSLWKNPKKEILSNLINCGIYIINPDVLDFIPKDTAFDFARDLFPIILNQGKRIFTHRIDKYWCDIDP